MSTTIYEKQLPEHQDSGFSEYLVVSQHGVSNKYAKEQNDGHKCVYQVRIGTEMASLTSEQMKWFVSDLNAFFKAEGYK
jgi:hypothetical protein